MDPELKDEFRLDVFLTKKHGIHSRSGWQKRITRGDVLVNNELCLKPNTKISESDTVTVAELVKQASQYSPVVLYEDENVLVVNKPSGILVHATTNVAREQTLVDIFADKLSFEQSNRPGVVHRLDRDTSGVIIFAKNEATKLYIQKQFANRSVKKTYRAVLSGQLATKKGVISKPLKRDPHHPGIWMVSPEGKPSETVFTRIDTSNDDSRVELEPKTGRTHQLRVHCASIGHPIVGDRLYNPNSTATRLMLHAASLEVSIAHNDRRTFAADLPEGF